MAHHKLHKCRDCGHDYASLATHRRCYRCSTGEYRGHRTDWRGVYQDRYLETVEHGTPEQRLKALSALRKVHEHGIDALRNR